MNVVKSNSIWWETLVPNIKHLSHFHSAHYAQDKLDEFIDVINAQLQPMFMEIRKGMSEEDGLQYYALVSDSLRVDAITGKHLTV